MAITTPLQITIAADTPLADVKPEVRKRAIADSATLSVAEYFWEKGHETVGNHAHAYDTANYIVAGRFQLEMEGRSVVLGPGDSYTVPAGVARTMRALEDGSYILVMARDDTGS